MVSDSWSSSSCISIRVISRSFSQFSFVMKKEGLDFSETLHLLADRVGILLPSVMEKGPGKDEKEKLFQIKVSLGLWV